MHMFFNINVFNINIFQKKWATLMSPDEQPPAKRGKDSKDTHMSALENMSANPNYRKK